MANPSTTEEKPPSNPPEVVDKAEVKFSYTAENPDELSVTVGEVLEVVSKDADDGWWEVRRGDETGLVPSNFVLLLSSQPSQHQEEKPPSKSPDKQVDRAKVLFDYVAVNSDELSVTAGEVLEVVSKDREEGWWEVRRGGRTGLVPDNFVELLPPQPAQHQEPPRPTLHTPSAKPLQQPPVQTEAPPAPVNGPSAIMAELQIPRRPPSYQPPPASTFRTHARKDPYPLSEEPVEEEPVWKVPVWERKVPKKPPREDFRNTQSEPPRVKSLPAPPRVSKPGIVSEPGKIHYFDLEFMEKVGVGGFGTVSKGRWISENKIVAIKAMVDLEEREVRILSSLDHPSVIQYYGTATQGNMQFIVTEFAENGSIYDYIHEQHKQPPLSQILLWAAQVAEGIVYLHQRDIIHRDLKSSNVVLTFGMNAKICDLGSARDLQHTTKMTTAIGTYSWMSPEMLRREEVSKSCDVYSYGVLVFEMATQQVPFHDVVPIVAAVMTMEGKRPTIPEQCDSHLADLITCCWQQDAKDRPSFVEILRTLDTITN